MRFLMVPVLVGVALAAQPGWSGEGVVALQTAAPSCRNNFGDRYVDCGNGTVTDNQTGLVWLRNANCLGAVTWHEAMDFVAGLSDLPGSDNDDCGLSDGSSPGEWSLPSKGEWIAMIAEAVALGCTNPSVTYGDGTTCLSTCPINIECSYFTSIESESYWSSTSAAISGPGGAWAVDLKDGDNVLWDRNPGNPIFFWPVRRGQ